MNMRIDVSELYEIINLTPPNHNILLIGKHGIGKSQILTEYYQKKGINIVSLFLGQMSDPGDLIGLPNKDNQTGLTDFLPPYWWPIDNKAIILFLDELNRARPELLQSIQELALNKTLAGKKLPEGSRVIAAVNAGDEYHLTDLDPALVSRFNIYEFLPSVNDWLAWAHKKKLDDRVITFIQKNNNYLDSPDQNHATDDLIAKNPDRRSWERVSDIVKSHETIDLIKIKIIAGIVGVQPAIAFHKFVESMNSITPDIVFNSFSKQVINQLNTLPLQDIIYLNEKLLFWINENIQGMSDSNQKKGLLNIEKYLSYLNKSDRREAIANLFNDLQNGDFDHSRNFLVQSHTIIDMLSRFAESIKL